MTSPLALDVVADAGLEILALDSLDLGRAAAETGATLVHVDDYATPDVRSSLAPVDVLLSSMEDGSFGRRPADLVIDSTIGAEDAERPVDGSGVVLLGIEYAPMRPQVRQAAERRRSAPPVPDASGVHCVVVMGGTDAVGAAAVVTGVCGLSSRIARCTVVAPEERWAAIRKAGRGLSLELLLPFPGLLDLASRADVVISAAGTTAWELACIGVPTALVAVVDNQVDGYEVAVARGIGAPLGLLADLERSPEQAASVLDEMIMTSSSRTAPSRLDGLGASRIVDAWEELLASAWADVGPRSVIEVRPAVSADAAVLLRWRNDPVTRTVSRTTDRVRWSDHVAWLERVLASPERLLLVAESDGRRVGTVRFDALDGGCWEVSITLAPEVRGRGLAARVLEAAESAFSALRGQHDIVATILPENRSSQAVFRRRGYVLMERGQDSFDVLVKRAEVR
ncbi:GNAT family N-acetyltransferase [Oerskovia enterophila]|uniref:GNAT family N-acetyltransferase n=1 Tax=Oerskovia enterophila TaxID=43678 RepID=UPI0037FD3C66